MPEQYYLITKVVLLMILDEKYCNFLGPHPFTRKCPRRKLPKPKCINKLWK